MLRRPAKHGKRMNDDTVPDVSVAGNHHMRMQDAIIAQANLRANMAKRTDLNIAPDLSAVFNDGCWMNLHYNLRPLLIAPHAPAASIAE